MNQIKPQAILFVEGTVLFAPESRWQLKCLSLVPGKAVSVENRVNTHTESPAHTCTSISVRGLTPMSCSPLTAIPCVIINFRAMSPPPPPIVNSANQKFNNLICYLIYFVRFRLFFLVYKVTCQFSLPLWRVPVALQISVKLQLQRKTYKVWMCFH